jgi:hypothetical protein
MYLYAIVGVGQGREGQSENEACLNIHSGL